MSDDTRSGLVTIGIPTHNRSALLERCLRGALAQTYRNIEIIVSDDASSDDTPQRMRKFNDPRIIYLRSEKNLGIARNTNICLEHATGELLLILNDDDELEPEAIEKLSLPFRRSTHGIDTQKIAVTWCPCSLQTAERQVRWITEAGPAVEEGLDLVVGLFNGIRGPRFCGVMVRTSHARCVGGYAVRHGPIPDVGNWSQVAIRYGFAVCVPEPLARYTAHNASCTGTSKARAWQEAGEAIFEDLAGYYQFTGDKARMRKLKAARRNFICGLLVTVIMQAMGKPGWVKLAFSEILRVPHYFLTPMLARRILVDGHKLLRRPAKTKAVIHLEAQTGPITRLSEPITRLSEETEQPAMELKR